MVYDKNSIKTIQIFKVSIDFSSQITRNSLASGGFAPRTTYKCIFLNYLNFSPNFRQKFVKILKKFWKKFEKIAKFSWKLLKFFYIFHWIFLQNFWKLLRRHRGSAPRNPPRGYPFTSPPLVDLASPPPKNPTGANVHYGPHAGPWVYDWIHLHSSWQPSYIQSCIHYIRFVPTMAQSIERFPLQCSSIRAHSNYCEFSLCCSSLSEPHYKNFSTQFVLWNWDLYTYFGRIRIHAIMN